MLVTIKGIPLSEDMILPESGFFTRQDALHKVPLPSPAAVREEGVRQHGGAANDRNRPPPVKFPELGLIVKYGFLVSVAEAQCLCMVRQHLPEVPVPEVYGWQYDDRQGFIYMELVEGDTLEDAWDSLSENDRVAVCGQLRSLAAAWRRLPQELFANTPFIGNVVGQELLDWVFVNSCSVGTGPFPSVSQFHDWYTSAYGPYRLGRWDTLSPHPYRGQLPDSVPIVFSHADLHPTNIMLAPRDANTNDPNNSPPRIAAIIDWQQSGWYPAYWEYCKSRWAWSRKVGDAWLEQYLPLILDVDEGEECYDVWDHFVCARGM